MVLNELRPYRRVLDRLEEKPSRRGRAALLHIACSRRRGDSKKSSRRYIREKNPETSQLVPYPDWPTALSGEASKGRLETPRKIWGHQEILSGNPLQ